MDEHDLLIRHAQTWADNKGRPLDRGLLQTAIELRGFHDEWAPQQWPAGSVEHLMLLRWPSHGPAEEPDVEALVATLDTFWRFLRGTGRMSSVSADPKILVKEAKRSAEEMRQACADPGRHGTAKTLQSYAASIGLPLDSADSMEELNERMQTVMESFNSLPEEERKQVMPSPSAAHGSIPGESATTLMAQAQQQGRLDEGTGGEDDMLPRMDPAVVAEQVRSSPFVRQCLALADWVGSGREVTATGVLRLAPAREVYAELDLWEWERSHDTIRFGADLTVHEPEAQALLRDAAMHSFRSAADCLPLQRLWLACEAAHLIDIGRTKARATAAYPDSDETWIHLGLTLLASIPLSLPSRADVAPLLGTLLPLLTGRDRISEQELCDWWWGREENFYRRLAEHVPEYARSGSDQWLRAALWRMDDTGVWRHEGPWLYRTELGHEFAMIVVNLLNEGMLET